MVVSQGKTFYHGRKVFKAGQEIPPYLEVRAKKFFEKSNKQNQPQEKQEKKKEKFDFKKEDK